jgi:hypothetical protein
MTYDIRHKPYDIRQFSDLRMRSSQVCRRSLKRRGVSLRNLVSVLSTNVSIALSGVGRCNGRCNRRVIGEQSLNPELGSTALAPLVRPLPSRFRRTHRATHTFSGSLGCRSYAGIFCCARATASRGHLPNGVRSFQALIPCVCEKLLKHQLKAHKCDTK